MLNPMDKKTNIPNTFNKSYYYMYNEEDERNV